MEVTEHSIEICDPQDQYNNNQSVQDRFDLTLHGDEPVHQPQQKACCNERDEDRGKGHFVFSSRFLDVVPQASSGSCEQSTHIAWCLKKGRTVTRLQPYSSKSMEKYLS
jgi:hypothetical protein